MPHDALGTRMKEAYENRYRISLTRRTPVIIRLDGRAFHTFTRKYDKPFSAELMNSMDSAACYVAEDIQGCKLAYVQSDEVSFLLTDYDNLETEAWFDYNLQKMVSVAASMMSVKFVAELCLAQPMSINLPVFDGRAFNIPKEEVANLFLWRAKDWQRNSLQMYARSFFSHKQLHNKGTTEIHEMLHSIDKNWTTDLQPYQKNGTFLIRSEIKGFYRKSDVLPTYEDISKLVDPFLVENND